MAKDWVLSLNRSRKMGSSTQLLMQAEPSTSTRSSMVWAVKHFWSYLIGQKCRVYTDHAPLKSMLYARHQTGKLARWSNILAEVDLEICYRPGRTNSNADALSTVVSPGGCNPCTCAPILCMILCSFVAPTLSQPVM